MDNYNSNLAQYDKRSWSIYKTASRGVIKGLRTMLIFTWYYKSRQSTSSLFMTSKQIRSMYVEFNYLLSFIPTKQPRNKLLDIRRSGNPGVLALFGGHNLPPLVNIGLTYLPKSEGAMAPPAPPGTTGLYIDIRFQNKGHVTDYGFLTLCIKCQNFFPFIPDFFRSNLFKL